MVLSVNGTVIGVSQKLATLMAANGWTNTFQNPAATSAALLNATDKPLRIGVPFDASLHALAKAAGAVVNVVDQPALCDALTPSIVDRSPVVVAIGTEGTAPVLARQIKSRVEEILEPRLGELAAVAGRLRERAALRFAPRDRRYLWRWVFSGPPRSTHAGGQKRDAARMMKSAIDSAGFGIDRAGSVALVCAGPGDMDLITLRGVQRLQEAGVTYYDHQIDAEFLDLARQDAERIFIGKAPNCYQWPQDRITGIIISAARNGKRVVYLKPGNLTKPAIGDQVLDALNETGFTFEIVPGVIGANSTTTANEQSSTSFNECVELNFLSG